MIHISFFLSLFRNRHFCQRAFGSVFSALAYAGLLSSVVWLPLLSAILPSTVTIRYWSIYFSSRIKRQCCALWTESIRILRPNVDASKMVNARPVCADTIVNSLFDRSFGSSSAVYSHERPPHGVSIPVTLMRCLTFITIPLSLSYTKYIPSFHGI